MLTAAFAFVISHSAFKHAHALSAHSRVAFARRWQLSSQNPVATSMLALPSILVLRHKATIGATPVAAALEHNTCCIERKPVHSIPDPNLCSLWRQCRHIRSAAPKAGDDGNTHCNRFGPLQKFHCDCAERQFPKPFCLSGDSASAAHQQFSQVPDANAKQESWQEMKATPMELLLTTAQGSFNSSKWPGIVLCFR